VAAALLFRHFSPLDRCSNHLADCDAVQTLNAYGDVVDATANTAEQSASSNRNQIGVTAGLNHQF